MTYLGDVSDFDSGRKAGFKRHCTWLRLFLYVVFVCYFKYDLRNIFLEKSYVGHEVYCSDSVEINLSKLSFHLKFDFYIL